MKDWEINPDNYAKDENGEFILKLDGTPRKKSGRAKGSKGKGYTYHSQTKAKMAAKKQVKQQEFQFALFLMHLFPMYCPHS